ncbi:ribonuclease III [Fimbriiglobus ruber]|uniref:Ribonuclease 3 n=1 Tax=Fimbriiglobus ruber TaxID=1908690 RepID=A0A225E4P7_9BACT|nr:ribonuclease III [Fimbriiglobus ruber]OWK43655.1 Ribonuclease III [Fimbriiglobus ruber]
MLPTETTTSRDRTVLEECQESIGYKFRKPELLRAALTHTSGANTRGGSNERMEFLGDSVLGLVTCEQLYLRFPEYQEGDMTKVKSVVVSRKTCAKFSEELGLGDFLFLGKGMNNGYGDIPPNILADVFEALVAAIFLDGGWDAAKEFVLHFIEPEIERVASESVNGNSKSVLQQIAQREFGDTPRYVILDEQGPDHNKCFKIAAEIAGHRYPPAWGKNKKEAELKAALNAIAAVQGVAIPHPSN